MFIFICVFFPILFVCVAGIADKYLAVGMQDLSVRFNLSPTLAAVTLIALANGAPDMLSNLNAGAKAGGALLSLGSSMGGLVFSLTMVISNVIMSAKREIVFPKVAIMKELGFIFMVIFWVVVFAFIGTSGYPFLGCYLATYIIYIVVTLVVEKYAGKTEENDFEGEM